MFDAEIAKPSMPTADAIVTIMVYWPLNFTFRDKFLEIAINIYKIGPNRAGVGGSSFAGED
ncbi:MAG: hypothetical protein PUB39_03310 [Eubacteriales bacterium]|nr:hypothetical protein [Eubacteriales bacterium]